MAGSSGDQAVLAPARSVCPRCLQTIDAQLSLEDGRVIMRKTCPRHGRFAALVSSDADMYLASLAYDRPGRLPSSFSVPVSLGCPWDCGLCPEHQQHTCLALVEVTSACDLACPVCFADAQAGFTLSLSQVESMLDRLLELEGRPEVVQFSGGEPTLHPQITEILGLARERDIEILMLNTNGVRIAEDDAFLAQLADLGPVIYLQFDGFEPLTHRALRGRDLLSLKLRALERLAQSKLDVVLVPTIEKHVNHAEIGEIVRFGIDHPAVRGIAFQPVTHSGRLPAFDPLDRETNADVIHGIAEQTAGMFQESDFVPVPCCHPTCRSATYAFVERGQVTPLPRVVAAEEYLDRMTNRTLPEVDEAVLRAMCELSDKVPRARTMWRRLRCAACGYPWGRGWSRLKESIFTIVVQDFADAYTMDLDVLKKCCVGELLPDGRIIPFCAYNSLGYRERTRAELATGPSG
jgi:uncharacterized radical SAM superfamily Fe-S cluster-containing enzyme